MPRTRGVDVPLEQSSPTLADSWEWLRHDGPRAVAWQQAQVQKARADIASGPTYDRAHQLLTDWASPPLAPPARFGDAWFEVVRADDGERLVLRTALDTPPIVLVDPVALVDDGRIDWYEPSPDGSRVAVGISA